MNMNAYDFDKTIYRRDSTVGFYLWCVRRYPKVMLRWPELIGNAVLYRLKKISKHVFMERFYQYLHDVKDVRAEVERYWDAHEADMHGWYGTVQREDDILISASPLFLIAPIAGRLGIKHVLASPLNPDTGLYEGERCHGEGKVRALLAAYPGAEIEAFYSDSQSDTPMARLARRAYLVEGERLTDWPVSKAAGKDGGE